MSAFNFRWFNTCIGTSLKYYVLPEVGGLTRVSCKISRFTKVKIDKTRKNVFSKCLSTRGVQPISSCELVRYNTETKNIDLNELTPHTHNVERICGGRKKIIRIEALCVCLHLSLKKRILPQFEVQKQRLKERNFTSKRTRTGREGEWATGWL